MEYERQSREQRQHASTGVTATGAQLRGPVGIRWRVENVTNSSDDQEKVIALLAAIPAKDGGKKEDWGVPPLAGPSGICPKVLADAIWDFQSWWKALGTFRNIDGVVDPGGNTLNHLNRLAARGGISPGPGPSPPGVLGLKADPGQWWIKGVDTFGVPIKAGASAAKIAVTLLNDQGETYTINGYGAGVAVGADFETEKLGKILGRLAEIGLKSGDIANIHKKLSAFGPFSRTAGAVLRRGSLISNYTIHEIKKAGTMCVTSAAASKHYGIEIGLITFFPSAMITPIELAVMFGQIASGEPWGAYGNFSGGKISLEVGYMTYLITSVDKG